VAQNLFSERTSALRSRPAGDSICLGAGCQSPRDHSFYPSCRYWYKRAFFARQTPDVLVFSEGSGADPHRSNFGISVCFQAFWS
jgi:hypothetical protein